jgi:hypothetical protein
VLLLAAAIGAGAAIAAACGGSIDNSDAERAAVVEQGKQTFRFDTFVDEVQ